MDIKAIEERLMNAGSPFLEGYITSQVDNAAFNALRDSEAVPNPKEYPHAFAWYCCVGHFAQNARDAWQSKDGNKDARKSGKGEKKA